MTKDEVTAAIDQIYQLTQGLLNTIMPIDSGFSVEESLLIRLELLDIVPQIMIRQVGRNSDERAIIACAMVANEHETIVKGYLDDIASGAFRRMINEGKVTVQ